MQTRLFALVVGIIYVILGIISFIPALHSAPPSNAPHVDATAAYGYLFGLFPVNIVLNLFYILVGLIGILCGRTLGSAIVYSRALFLLFGILTVFGFIPNANTLWGIMPLLDADVWLHAVTAVLGAIFGFVIPMPSTELEPAAA